MDLRNFLGELKRRNVYRVGAAYVVVSWLLIQVATQVFPFFEIPDWAVRLVVMLLALGFPIALIVAWAFELTPEGLQLTRSTAAAPAPRGRRAPKALFWSLIAIGAIAGLFLSFWFGQRSAAPLSVATGPSLTEKRGVAVLPFENLSEEKANAYFADGMQDEIITRLAKIGDLKVISRTSTLPYRGKQEKVSEIARQLGVAHIVEGTVQKIADRVRINVQLIEAATDQHLWAELYDRNVTDVFELQSEVATKIATSLQAKLSGREQKAVNEKLTDNVAAYDAYLRGVDLASRPGQHPHDMEAAAAAFAEAVRLDPQFATAWARLAEMSASLYFQHLDGTEARRELAQRAVETVTRLAPDNPDTLFANAYYRYHIERDYEGARQLFEKIRRDIPSSSDAIAALARIARRQSRWKDSLRLFEEASKLNPRDAHLFMDRSWTYSMLRDHPSTLAMLEAAEAIRPNDPDILANKVYLHIAKGDLAAARSVLDRIPSDAKKFDSRAMVLTLERRYAEAAAVVEQKRAAIAPGQPHELGFASEWLGLLRALAGDAEGARAAYLEAKEVLERLAREQPQNIFVAGALAQTYVGLSDKKAALREAARGVAALPASQDAVFGPLAEETLARVEAQVGEHDRAIARLERLLRTPYGAYPITVGRLRLDPIWDPLRQHPGFKAIVEGPEPQTIF
ncbi:hypothetical protein BH20VER1_BH20VER1_06600 [soil metagenome]